MYYVEFLRVLRSLRGLGYVLGGLIVLTVVMLPWSHNNMSMNLPEAQPNTMVTRTLADGTTIEDYTDRKGRRVHVQEVRGGVVNIRITEPSRIPGHPPKTIQVSHDRNISIDVLIVISSCVATLIASIFGLALSRENDGHLELAWTKPASRERYALAAIAIDIAGFVTAGVAALLTIFIVFAIEGGAQYIKASGDTIWSVVFGVVFPMSIYAMILAATSSLRRGAQVLAIFLPVALLLPLMSGVGWMNVGTVARVLNTFNPVAYFYGFVGGMNAGLLPAQTTYQILVPLAIAVVSIAASLAQWRRLEA